MEKHTFNVSINASREKVWDTLWRDDNYRAWTSVFAEGSTAVTDWKKGSKALFTDGKGEGMVSTIVENKPNEFMSIKHLGIVKGGVEDLDSEETLKWAGALENYALETKDGDTLLTVDMDITDDYKDYFLATWPKALDKVKQLAEKN